MSHTWIKLEKINDSYKIKKKLRKKLDTSGSQKVKL